METRSLIAKCLGALWILDGLLQFQSAMFGPSFVTDVLVPNLSAQPQWLINIVSFGIYLWNLNPVFNDIGAGLLQIAIGVLLLTPLSSSWFKTGAWISIFWGIVVWFCGEGAGQLFAGIASFYTGAPGAVLLYVLLAFRLLNPTVPLKRYVQLGALIFILGAVLQLQSAFWSVDGVQGAAMAAMMEPYHALNVFPIYVSNLLGINPTASNLLLIALPLAIGIWLFWKPSRTAGIIALIFLLLVWWVGQDFGLLSTVPHGTATDPDTAPILALFLLPLLRRNPGATLKR